MVGRVPSEWHFLTRFPPFPDPDSHTMRTILCAIWPIVSVLIICLSFTAPATAPAPVCHPLLGENIIPHNCREAFLQFNRHKSNVTGSNDRKKIYYFSNDPNARTCQTWRGRNTNVLLPLVFSSQNCSITVRMPPVVKSNPVKTSWSRITNAIRHLYLGCVSRPTPTGGYVEYHGLVITMEATDRAHVS